MSQPLPNATGASDANGGGKIEPRAYTDPAADAVLRSACGRDFRVQSYMLKANSTKLREALSASPSTPVEVAAERKTLKLALDLMHLVPLPASYVWHQHERLFALCDELGCDSVIERALALCIECASRDPWGMFVAASQRSNTALAKAALMALAYEDPTATVDFGSSGAPDGGDAFPRRRNGFPPTINGHHHAHSPAPTPAPARRVPKSAKAVAPPPLAGLNPANSGNITLPFMLGLFNAALDAASDGHAVTWSALANRFEPVFEDDAAAGKVASIPLGPAVESFVTPSKKAAKLKAAHGSGGHHSHAASLA